MNELDIVCYICIFKKLDWKSLVNVSMINKRIYNLCKKYENVIWKHLPVKNKYSTLQDDYIVDLPIKNYKKHYIDFCHAKGIWLEYDIQNLMDQKGKGEEISCTFLKSSIGKRTGRLTGIFLPGDYDLSKLYISIYENIIFESLIYISSDIQKVKEYNQKHYNINLELNTIYEFDYRNELTFFELEI